MRLTLAACAVLALVAVLALSLAERAEAKGSFAVLSGGDLARPIHVPYGDTRWVPNSDDPWQAYDRPRPTDRPDTLGDMYALRTDYVSAELARRGTEPDGWEMTYYPEQAAVAFVVNGAEQWYVIDVEVDALLERYLAVGRAGLLPDWPSRLHLALGESTLSDAPVAVTAEMTPYGPWRGDRIPLDAAELWRHLLRVNGTYREIHSTEFEDRRTHLSPWRGDVWPIDRGRDQVIILVHPDGTEHVLTYLVEHDLLVYSASPGMPWWYGWDVDEEFMRFLQAHVNVEGEEPAAASTSGSRGTAVLLVVALGAAVAGVVGIGRAAWHEVRR